MSGRHEIITMTDKTYTDRLEDAYQKGMHCGYERMKMALDDRPRFRKGIEFLKPEDENKDWVERWEKLYGNEQ